MSRITVTTVLWGEMGLVEASNVAQLARKLYTRCPFWTRATCDEMAAALARGVVLTVQDAEAVFLPGRFQVAEASVGYDESWTPTEVAR